MKPPTPRLGAWLGALSLSLAGCGKLEVGLDVDDSSREVRVLSWWGSSQSSLNYYRALGDSLSEQTRLHLVPVDLEALRADSSLAPGDNSPRAHKLAISELLLDRDEEAWPDAFLTNDGYDVLRWTPCGGMDPPRLVPLGSFFEPGWLESTFPRQMLDALRCEVDGEVYALPLSMHRINHVLYNRQRLAAPEVAFDESQLGELGLADLERMSWRLSRSLDAEASSDGTRTRPVFALPQLEPSSIRLLLLDNLMRASMPDEYPKLWRGEADWAELDARPTRKYRIPITIC